VLRSRVAEHLRRRQHLLKRSGIGGILTGTLRKTLPNRVRTRPRIQTVRRLLFPALSLRRALRLQFGCRPSKLNLSYSADFKSSNGSEKCAGQVRLMRRIEVLARSSNTDGLFFD
jgi:hypothetical protein